MLWYHDVLSPALHNSPYECCSLHTARALTSPSLPRALQCNLTNSSHADTIIITITITNIAPPPVVWAGRGQQYSIHFLVLKWQFKRQRSNDKQMFRSSDLQRDCKQKTSCFNQLKGQLAAGGGAGRGWRGDPSADILANWSYWWSRGDTEHGAPPGPTCHAPPLPSRSITT